MWMVREGWGIETVENKLKLSNVTNLVGAKPGRTAKHNGGVSARTAPKGPVISDFQLKPWRLKGKGCPLPREF